MLITANNSLKNLLVIVSMAEENEIVDEDAFSQNLKKIKKSKILTKSKTPIDLAKSYNIYINIRTTKFLILEAQVAFN